MTNTTNEPASDLPKLSQPAHRALAAAGYVRLEQFTHVRAAEVRQLHGVGPKGIRLIRAALAAKGKAFADEPEASDSTD